MKKRLRNILLMCLSLVVCGAIICGTVVLATNISASIDKKNNEFDINKEGIINVSYENCYSKKIQNVCLSKNGKTKSIDSFEFDEFEKNKILNAKCFKGQTKDGKVTNVIIDKYVVNSNNRIIDYYEERYDKIFYYIQNYNYYLASDISVWEKENQIFFFFIPNVNLSTCTELFYYPVNGEVTHIEEFYTDNILGLQILKNL